MENNHDDVDTAYTVEKIMTLFDQLQIMTALEQG